jgi:hypothetical protein
MNTAVRDMMTAPRMPVGLTLASLSPASRIWFMDDGQQSSEPPLSISSENVSFSS